MDERKSEASPDLAAALDAVAADMAQTAGTHPKAAMLVDYHHDRLAPEIADGVQEHLAACRDCSDLLLELVRFDIAEPDTVTGAGAQVADLETEAAWRALASEIDAAPSTHEVSEGVPVRPKARPSRPAPLIAALAASVVISLGLAGWVATLRSELSARRQPQINVPILYLEPPGSIRGDYAHIATGEGSGPVMLILNSPSSTPAVAHELEILADPDGRTVWRHDGLLPTETGDFHLELNRGLLPPGSYRLQLLRDDVAIAVYDLIIGP